MSLVNIISVPTSNGIKTIEIHNGDITDFYLEFDILVISAFKNGYFPVPGTVMGSLYDKTKIDLREVSKTPLINLRSSLNCWVSKSIDDQNFKHIICLEGISANIKNSGSSADSLSNLFGFISLLEYKGIESSSIAMPLLGAGNQNSSVSDVLSDLIQNAIKSLNTNANLKTIYFVELNEGKAKLIDKTINNYLNRGADKLELMFEDNGIKKLLEQTLSKLIIIQKEFLIHENETIINFIDKINKRNLRFFELGIFCRKLQEILLSDLTSISNETHVSLFDYITDLKSKNISDWMITYLHTLRVFGNYVAHEGKKSRIPKHMEKTDVIVFILSLNRFLEFYIDFKSNPLADY